MEDEDSPNGVFRNILAERATRQREKLTLREEELRLYTQIVTVFSQKGSLSEKNKKLMGDLKVSLGISEERHAAECRRVVTDPAIRSFSERVHGRNAMEIWKNEGYANFPSLCPLTKRVRVRDCIREEVPSEAKDLDSPAFEGIDVSDVSDTEEHQFASTLWSIRAKKVHKKVQTSKIGHKREKVMSSDEESVEEKIRPELREQSPDITDTPTTPNKNKVHIRNNASIKRARGAKRKLVNMSRSSPVKIEPPSKVIKKTIMKQGSGRRSKINKSKLKLKFMERKPSLLENEHDNSEDEIPKKEEMIRNNLKISAPVANRGRGLTRVRGRGSRSRGGRGRHNMIITTNKPSYPTTTAMYEYQRSPSPRLLPPLAHRSGISPERIHQHHHHPLLSHPTSPIKTLKVLKPKKTKIISVSRRKSRLKEKEDDEMHMEWNDNYDDDNLIMSNKRIPIKKRKNFAGENFNRAEGIERDGVHRDREEGGVIDNIHETRRLNGVSDQTGNDDRDRDLNERICTSIDIFGRPDSSRISGGTLSGEETDSASEKGSISGSRCNDSPNSIQNSNNNSNSNSNSRASISPPPGPPARQKQRLKTPLTSNPQLPRITLPPPVFSTSLSSVHKKRPAKHISVVDSLNLHLPTTPTASSLAASSSSRRPSIMGGSSSSGGCSIFSNSQALLANSRGGPGILQQQRKAHPHILANSKVHQRTFLPNTQNSSGNNNNLSLGVSGSTIGIPSNNSIVASTAGTIMTPGIGVHQVQTTTVIPSIPVSSGTAVAMQLPGPSGSPLTMSGAIPLGSVPASRAAGTNFIFLQKASNPPTAVTSCVGLPSNSLPVRASSPRAVILRRTTQIPRQGNVMFLDVQKNQMVNTGQVPHFLQTTRILTAPSELSVLNLQANHSPRKVIQTQSTDHSDHTSVVYSVSSGQQRKTKLVGTQLPIVTSIPSTFSTTSTSSFKLVEQKNTTAEHSSLKEIDIPTIEVSSSSQKDSQFAQIEAELMEMEQGIAYEEEVVTSSEMVESISSLNSDPVCSSNQVPASQSAVQPYPSNASSNSVPVGIIYGNNSSTDTASESESTFSTPTAISCSTEGLRQKSIAISLSPKKEIRQMSDAVTRALVSSGSGSKNASPTKDNSSLEQPLSQPNYQPLDEDIFQAALKSSGIVFPEHQFFGAEEEISTNIDEPTNEGAAAMNHCANSTQGNGTALQ